MSESPRVVTATVADGADPERRVVRPDRRGRFWRSLLYGGMNPRRRSGRRDLDDHRPIIDWHGPELFASATLVLILCVVDAFLTLRLLSGGAIEANPFMEFFVYGDARRFALTKLSLTGAGLLTLVGTARFKVFRFVRAAMLVHAFLIAYLILIGYELLLLQASQG
jgi:hypothetical protein